MSCFSLTTLTHDARRCELFHSTSGDFRALGCSSSNGLHARTQHRYLTDSITNPLILIARRYVHLTRGEHRITDRTDSGDLAEQRSTSDLGSLLHRSAIA